MAVRAVTPIAIAIAAALAGCDVESEPDRPTAGQSPARDNCAYRDARDAGDAQPSRQDPRTLVLRLRDLPRTFEFNSRMGVERLTFEGGEVSSLLDRTGFREAALANYRGGRKLPHDYGPGGPPPSPPPACVARNKVVSAALVFGDAGGAQRAYLKRELLASSAAGLGAGPVGTRTRRSPAAVAGSDEAELLVHRTDHDSGVQHAMVWRQGPVIGIVSVEGDRRSPDTVLVPQLARRQAARIAASN